MNCPYPDCNAKKIQAGESHCPKCQRQLKMCNRKTCSTPNRSFAMYCCNCGGQLPEADTNWPMLKGGPQKLGLNRFMIPRGFSDLNIEEIATLRMSDGCRSLLIYDNYLFSFSQGGEVRITDISQTPVKELDSFNVGGNIYSIPALANGSLYVGTEKHLQAYSLGNLLSEKSPVAPRWDIPVTGTPVRSLLPVENRLFFTIADQETGHEIQMVDNIKLANPTPPETLFRGTHLSWIAGSITPNSKRIYFLSSSNGTMVHVIDLMSGSKPELKSVQVKRASSKFKRRVPIAVMGVKIFAVFRGQDTLCRLDAGTGEIDRQFCKNVREFVMEGVNEPVAAKSKGLFIKKINQDVPLVSGQTIRGWPIILKGCAVASGMQDGTVLLHDIRNPALPRIWPVSEHPNEPVTAMASSKNIIAAGNTEGLVKLCRLS